MKIVGVNGFGRIGRCFTRLALMDPTIDVALVNDLADITTLAHLLKYDSVRGGLNLSFTIEGNSILFSNGKKITFVNEKNPEDIDWSSHNVNYVLESTGLFLSKEAASKHLKPGVKKVILSAPPSDNDIKSIVLGVNEDQLSTEDLLVSNASCTTNCLSPVAKVLNDSIGIVKGFMTTIHSYTGDQPTLDTMHKDLYRARAAALSMIPTSTGAAKAVGLVLPELKGKLDGVAIRVPTPNVSVVDLVFEASRATTIDEVNAAIRAAADGRLKGILGYTDQPNVSSDFNHDPHSSVFHMDQTKVLDGTMVRILAWYDNEWGFSNRMADTAVAMGKLI